MKFVIILCGGLICLITNNTYAQNTGVYDDDGKNPICLGCTVNNPTALGNNNPTDYTTLCNPVAALGGNTYINVDFPSVIPAGGYITFVVSNSSFNLLDLTLLGGLTLVTLDNGNNPIETFSVGTGLNISLLQLPGGLYQITIQISQDAAGAEIQLNSGIAGALTCINVHEIYSQVFVPLYASLTYWNIENKEGSTFLVWNLKQTNEQYLVLEHSKDGQQYSTCQKFAISEKQSYEFKLSNSVFNYYRLKIVTMDNIYYSPAVSTKNKLASNKIAISVSPNPCMEKLNISADKAIKSVRIINLQGKEVFYEKYQTNNLSLNTNLKSGQYIISLFVEDQIVHQRIVVQ